MARPFVPKVASSNHLTEGDVIYFTGTGWTRHLRDAQVAGTTGEADALLSAASAYPLETVGVEMTDVDMSSGHPTPCHLRETVRTRGPSNYAHGKQADHV